MIKQRGGMRIAKILDVVEQTLNPIQHEDGRIRFSIKKEDIHKMSGPIVYYMVTIQMYYF